MGRVVGNVIAEFPVMSTSQRLERPDHVLGIRHFPESLSDDEDLLDLWE